MKRLNRLRATEGSRLHHPGQRFEHDSRPNGGAGKILRSAPRSILKEVTERRLRQEIDPLWIQERARQGIRRKHVRAWKLSWERALADYVRGTNAGRWQRIIEVRIQPGPLKELVWCRSSSVLFETPDVRACAPIEAERNETRLQRHYTRKTGGHGRVAQTRLSLQTDPGTSDPGAELTLYPPVPAFMAVHSSHGLGGSHGTGYRTLTRNTANPGTGPTHHPSRLFLSTGAASGVQPLSAPCPPCGPKVEGYPVAGVRIPTGACSMQVRPSGSNSSGYRLSTDPDP